MGTPPLWWFSISVPQKSHLLQPLLLCQPQMTTRHRRSTSTRWHFAFGLCCHSNETQASIANPPNSAQLGGTPYHSPKLHQGLSSSVGMWPQTDMRMQTDTQMRMTNIHFASSKTRAKCNNHQPPNNHSHTFSKHLVLSTGEVTNFIMLFTAINSFTVYIQQCS